MEPGPARAKANWLRLFSRVRLQLQEVQPMCVCMCVSLCVFGHIGVYLHPIMPDEWLLRVIQYVVSVAALLYFISSLFELTNLLHQPLHVLLLLCFFPAFCWLVHNFPSFWLLLWIILYCLVFIWEFLFTPCIVFAISLFSFQFFAILIAICM